MPSEPVLYPLLLININSKAANAYGIPSILITNFTFDSVYSYLSINFPRSSNLCEDDAEDTPISPDILQPLVDRLLLGYRCAQLLVRLPGDIPIPSFTIDPKLPSHLWTNPELNSFHEEVKRTLSSDVSKLRLLPSIPFDNGSGNHKRLPRRVIQSPLIVRHPSADAYTTPGRGRILKSIGIPDHLCGNYTKVLVVSFGGQTFRKPNSRTHSQNHSPTNYLSRTQTREKAAFSELAVPPALPLKDLAIRLPSVVATESHLLVPGAPPAIKSLAAREESGIVSLSQEATRSPILLTQQDTDYAEHDPQFLPDSSWIAIVCGASTKKSPDDPTDDSDELPENFFLAPRDVYMPDLTAVADVLLGKLGYGTVSECVDAATPFVFVSRPLFVEEHGLRALLEREGTGVELSREMYEAGDWAGHIAIAYEAGRERKELRRVLGNDDTRKKECAQLARQIVEWVHEWQRLESDEPSEGQSTTSDTTTTKGLIASLSSHSLISTTSTSSTRSWMKSILDHLYTYRLHLFSS